MVLHIAQLIPHLTIKNESGWSDILTKKTDY